MKGVLGYSEEPLVSVDYKGDPRSSIVDGLSTMVLEDDMVKLCLGMIMNGDTHVEL